MHGNNMYCNINFFHVLFFSHNTLFLTDFPEVGMYDYFI